MCFDKEGGGRSKRRSTSCAQAEEGDLSAKAEVLRERERGCFEAEGEMGRLDVDLGAVALETAERARDADCAAAASRRDGVCAQRVGETEFLRNRAEELSS